MKLVSLAELLGVPGVRDVVGDRNTLVSGVVSDSRRVGQGELFAAIVGGAVDGTRVRTAGNCSWCSCRAERCDRSS